MNVIKRNGLSEPVAFDKITARIAKLCYNLDPKTISAVLVAQKVIQGVYDGVSTAALAGLSDSSSSPG